jgi:hypothetical protein
MSRRKPTAADRPEFRRAMRDMVEKLGVAQITPDVAIVCTRASDFRPEDNVLWELEANKSAVRHDMHCAGCQSEMAMSNHAYARYTSLDKKPRVLCVQCVTTQLPPAP